MKTLYLFVIGFICAGVLHHFFVHENQKIQHHDELSSKISINSPPNTSSKLHIGISPTKMVLPEVTFQWNNVWYYLKGEPYISGVETRLSFEKTSKRDYVRLRQEAAEWIVSVGAKDWTEVHQGDFLIRIGVDVLLSAQEHQLYPSVIFAQSILESGWGQSKLAQDYNNLFGIKGYRTQQKIHTTTYEKINGHRVARQTSFRVFSSWGEAIQYHGNLLSTDSRYQHAKTAKNYKEYIDVIAEKYASEPDYADLVVQIVEKHQLNRWDDHFTPITGKPIQKVVQDDLLGLNYSEKHTFNFISTTLK